MATKHTEQSIREGFITGLWSIFRIMPNPFSVASILISIFLTIAFLIAVVIFHVEPYNLIVDIKTQSISFLPDILGFTIGGYAFLIGFNGSAMLDKISEPLSGSKYTLYQLASASFAFNIIIQAVTLIYSYLIHYIIIFDTEGKLKLTFTESFVVCINYVGLFISILLLILSLFMVVQIVLNVFNFSQLYHYSINKEKLDK